MSDVVFGASASALVTSALACCLSSKVRKILLACSPWYHQTLLVCLASSLKWPSAAWITNTASHSRPLAEWTVLRTR